MSGAEDLQKMSDEDLMARYVKDNQMAFEILYHRHAGPVLGYLSKKSQSAKLAQDLAQEVFLKLHRSRHLYNSMLPFSPWLFSITRSVFLDFAKKKSLENPTSQEEFDKMSVPTQAEIEPIDLSILPATQKQVVALRVYDEATFDEIAEKLSTTPENARQIFSRAIKSLKSILREGRDK